MVRYVTRRSALRTTGSLTGAVLLGTPHVAADSLPERFIVDRRLVPERVLERFDFEVVHRLDEIDALVIETPDVDLPDVTGIVPDVTVAHSPPLDDHEPGSKDPPTSEPDFRLQWDKQALSVPSVHETTRGEGTRVAIIDTGIDPTHPDLEHAVNQDLSRNLSGDGGDFDDVGLHGTHLAGIVAANDRNATGILGTAPGTELVAVRVFEDIGTASFGDVLAGIVYSVQVGADAANLSLGSYPLSLTDVTTLLFRELFERAGAFALANGTLPVAAVGNDATNLDRDGRAIMLPSEVSTMMSVSATGPIGFRWDDPEDVDDPLAHLQEPTWEPAVYTNYGLRAVDVSSPGGNFDRAQFDTGNDWFLDMVYSTIPNDVEGDYGWAAGTSMAVPHVAGAVALVRSVAPDLSATAVRRVLQRTATRREPRRFHGHGHLDVTAAVERARERAS